MTVVRCGVCDLVYVNPTFDEEHYHSVYASAEYQEIVRDLGISSHEYRVGRFGNERVALFVLRRVLRFGLRPDASFRSPLPG